MTSEDKNSERQPVNLLFVGMAGAGKSQTVSRIASEVHRRSRAASADRPPYVVNLDPAVAALPYEANIDIRDTVEYKRVMRDYGLGPNGAIMTSLNLFTTKFEQVLDLVEKRAEHLDYVLYDTPGQIEIFTWSAAGSILTSTLASLYPTVVVYVIDTPRTQAPATFMANMLYACSVLYRTRLPFLLAFNKCDVTPCEFAFEWMQDFEKFQEALRSDTTYMASLVQSMSLVLEEFYRHLNVVGISAATGYGMDDFFSAVDKAVLEYKTVYRPELDARIRAKNAESEAAKADSLSRLMKDMKVSADGKVVLQGAVRRQHAVNSDDEEQPIPNNEQDDDNDEQNVYDDDEDDEASAGQNRFEDASFKRYLVKE